MPKKTEVKICQPILSYPWTAEWKCPTLYLVWRICWSIYHTCWTIASGVLNYQWATTESNRIKWFVYLTNWTYLILTIETILEVFMLLYARVKRPEILKERTGSMPWFLKILWVLYNISTTGAIVVSALYWGMIYKASKGTNSVSVAVHGFNSVYVVLNIFVTALPVRIFHFYQPALFGIIYIGFTWIYYAANGTNMLDEPFIYPILDWSDVGKTITLVTISNCIAVPIMHLVVFLFYFLRNVLHSKITSIETLRRVENETINNGIDQNQNQNINDHKICSNGGLECNDDMINRSTSLDVPIETTTEKTL